MKYIRRVLFVFVILLVGIVSVNARLREQIYADDNVSVNENISGSGFVAGNNVSVNANVDGILFGAGNTITSKGLSDYALLAGNSITTTDMITKDAFIAGNSIAISNAAIERDLVVFGNSVNVSGRVGRNVNIYGTIVKISGVISGNVTISASTITVGEDTVILGSLNYNKDATISIAKSAMIGEVFMSEPSDSPYAKEISFAARAESTIIWGIGILLLGFVLMRLFKTTFERVTKLDSDFTGFLKEIAIGFGTLILTPIIAVLIIITAVGLPISIMTFGAWIIGMFLANLFTGYYFAHKLFNKQIKNKYLLLTIGVGVIYVLKLVPVIGGIVTFISMLCGLGIQTSLVFRRLKN